MTFTNLKNNFFDIAPALSKTKEKTLNEMFHSKYLLQHFQKIAHPDELYRVPTEEEFFFLQTGNSFNAFTFIPLVCRRESIKHLYASTYSISTKVINALIELHDMGKIERITLLISDSMIKRNPVIIDNLISMSKSRANIEVLFAWVHAKVCLMELENDHYIVEGSGNWSDNASVEQYMFANSKSLFDFRMGLFTDTKIRSSCADF